jgi:multidrug efflux pump subunit AcrA (membrane-fusion protein)
MSQPRTDMPATRISGPPTTDSPNEPSPPPMRVPLPAGRTRGRAWWRTRRVLIAAFALVLIVLVALVALAQRPADSTPTGAADAPVPAPRLTVRGVIRPLAQARVGTLNGGVLDRVSVAVGDRVSAAAELALVRPRSDAPVDVLTSPRAGRVLSVPVQVGDTLSPGSIVVVVADLSKLQAETTDLDEYLVARVQVDQQVTLNVPALDNRQLRAWCAVLRCAQSRPPPVPPRQTATWR